MVFSDECRFGRKSDCKRVTQVVGQRNCRQFSYIRTWSLSAILKITRRCNMFAHQVCLFLVLLSAFKGGHNREGGLINSCS